MTNYMQHNRTRSHWLLDDGSTLIEPFVEQSPAGRNVRIAGQNERVSKHDLQSLLYRHIFRKARQKGATPIWNLGGDPSDPEDEDQILTNQVGVIRQADGFAPFTRNGTEAEANWIFKHPSLPLHARIRLQVSLQSHRPPEANCTFIFPNFSKGSAQGWGNGRYRNIKDIFAYEGESNNLNALPEQLRPEARKIMDGLGLKWGVRRLPNNDAVMAEALRLYRYIDSLSEVTIPDTRDVNFSDPDNPGTLSVATLPFLRTSQPNHYLQEMQEYAESLEPASMVVEHWSSIVEILKRHGVQVSKVTQHQVLNLLTNADENELPVTINPIKRNPLGKGVDQDPNHKISIDLFTGVVYASCEERNRDTEKDLLAYELAKERAAITGETDLLEAFMASVGQVRADSELAKIVRDARHT